MSVGLSHREPGGVRVAVWCAPKSHRLGGGRHSPTENSSVHAPESKEGQGNQVQTQFLLAWESAVFSHQEGDELRESLVFEFPS